MSVTVERIMELEDIAQVARLVAGHGGISNQISFVTISEAPDFYQWVSGGEFVLSTLYAFKDQPELRAPAYKELAQRGVAAIGIKTKRFIDEIPADLIEIANEYNVPLFEIERETKFRQIIQAITAELNNDQTNLLLEIERHYKELAEVALISGDFDQLIRGFGRRRKGDVLCFRSDFKLLGSYPSNVQAAETDTVKEELAAYLSNSGELLQSATICGRHVFPCVRGGQTIGYLVLSGPEPLNNKFLLMAKQLTTFLTLKLIDQMDMDQRTLTALFDDILYKQKLNEDELRERLALHGLKQAGSYRVVVVRAGENETDICQSPLFRSYCAKLRTVLSEPLLINKPDEAVFIASGQQPDESSAPGWIKQLGTDSLTGTTALCIGVGPAVALAKDIHSSYLIAKSTVKAARSFQQGGLHYYSDFLARILLLRSNDTPEQKYLLSMVIAPLETQDQRYNTQLIQTLGALIFADDLESAAASLYVHINTVRYRLGKVKQLTGYDFFSAKGRYTLTTAYLMYCFSR